MNGIEKIIARLEAEAQGDIDALNADTKAACDKLLAEYEEKAKAAYDAAIREGQAGCASRKERMASAADLEARKKLLGFKQELVGEVFARAAEKLAALPKEEYITFLAKQAAGAAGAGGGELIFNSADAERVGKAVVDIANKRIGDRGEKLTLSQETRAIPGGVIVRQGDVEANCAIDMLVNLSRNDLASQVAEILFA